MTSTIEATRVSPLPTDVEERNETLDALNEALTRAGMLLRRLDSELTASVKGTLDTLTEEVSTIRKDRDLLASQLTDAVVQRARSMSLYVATYQLHATLDRGEVLAAIAEIAADLIGADTFVILLRDQEAEGWKVAFDMGLDPAARFFDNGRYLGGDPLVDQALVDSRVRIDQDQNGSAVAVVPLRMEATIVGVLAVFGFLAHKADSLSQDRELLDMLSDHAGSALVVAELYTSSQRKLKTLDRLARLIPRA